MLFVCEYGIALFWFVKRSKFKSNFHCYISFGKTFMNNNSRYIGFDLVILNHNKNDVLSFRV